MKKLAYITLGCCIALTTACVDLDQYPKSFITEEEYNGIEQDIWQAPKAGATHESGSPP